jgi:hypothetical protein
MNKAPSAKKPPSARPMAFLNKKGNSAKTRKKPEPYVSKYPEINFEKLKEVPSISVSVKNESIRSESGMFEIKLPVNMTLKKIIDVLNERHCYSCKNLRLYMRKNTNTDANSSDKNYLDSVLFKTFSEFGISGDSLLIYYEFEPINHPLLESGQV